MNDNQILVVHSRGVYSLMGLIMYSNLGHLLWRLQSMEGISIGNEKMSAFPHYRC